MFRCAFSYSELDPVALFYDAIHDHFVFQNTAIVLNAFGGADVVLVTDHQHFLNAQFFTFQQGQSDHLGRNPFAPFRRPDPVSDMPAV